MKRTRISKRYAAVAAFGLCLMTLTVIGSAYAYFSAAASIRNTLITKGTSIYLQELFDPNDRWLPGETKTKEVNFGNGGSSSQFIRFRIETQWRDSSNGDWNPEADSPVAINWTPSLAGDWTPVVSTDGVKWHYYNGILPAGGETPPVMDSAVFSQSLSNDSHDEDFTAAVYRIVVYLESLNANTEITAVEWGVVFTSDLEWVKLP